jgi:hypothetical protein
VKKLQQEASILNGCGWQKFAAPRAAPRFLLTRGKKNRVDVIACLLIRPQTELSAADTPLRMIHRDSKPISRLCFSLRKVSEWA